MGTKPPSPIPSTPRFEYATPMIMEKQNDTQPFRQTYIVRLWREDTPQASWNGQVQHIASGETTAIQDMDDLLEYFRAQLGTPKAAQSQPSKLK